MPLQTGRRAERSQYRCVGLLEAGSWSSASVFAGLVRQPPAPSWARPEPLPQAAPIAPAGGARKGDAAFSGCDGLVPSAGPSRLPRRPGPLRSRFGLGPRTSSGRRRRGRGSRRRGSAGADSAFHKRKGRGSNSNAASPAAGKRPRRGRRNRAWRIVCGCGADQSPRPGATPREQRQRTRRRASRKKRGENRGRRTATSCPMASFVRSAQAAGREAGRKGLPRRRTTQIQRLQDGGTKPPFGMPVPLG